MYKLNSLSIKSWSLDAFILFSVVPGRHKISQGGFRGSIWWGVLDKVKGVDVVSAGFLGCFLGLEEDVDAVGSPEEKILGVSLVQYFFCRFCTANRAFVD